MKHLKLTPTVTSSLLSCALAISALATAPVAAAQSGSDSVKVNIPFAFQANSQRMPAGTYQIDLSKSNVVGFRGTGPHASGFVMVHSAQTLRPASKGSVVFDRYGNTYYLHQIWQAGSTLGVECPKSRAEKETLQAQNNQAPTLVELALINEPRR